MAEWEAPGPLTTSGVSGAVCGVPLGQGQSGYPGTAVASPQGCPAQHRAPDAAAPGPSPAAPRITNADSHPAFINRIHHAAAGLGGRQENQ